MNGNKYIIQSSSGDNSFTTTLTVTYTEYDDRGTYSCSASNMIDGVQYTDSDSASLTVNTSKQHFLIYIITPSLLYYSTVLLLHSVQCTECNGARADIVACSIFDIWEGQEWVSDHGL